MNQSRTQPDKTSKGRSSTNLSDNAPLAAIGRPETDSRGRPSGTPLLGKSRPPPALPGSQAPRLCARVVAFLTSDRHQRPMRQAKWPRSLSSPTTMAAVLIVGLACTATAAMAASGQLRVRGSAAIRARALLVPNEGCRITGETVDELGSPIGNTAVLLRAIVAGGYLGPFTSCDGAPLQPLGAQWVVQADAQGRFCARLPGLDEPRASISLRVERSQLFEGTERRVQLDANLRQVELRLLSPPREMSLEHPPTMLQIEAVLTPPPSADEPAEELQVSVSVQAEAGPPQQLYAGQLRSGAPAEVPLLALASLPPGPATLLVRSAPGPSVQEAEARTQATITTVVVLTAQLLSESREGQTVRVVAVNPKGAVAPGGVELTTDERLRSLGPLEQGVATLSVPIKKTELNHRVELQFVPQSVGWRPGPPVTLLVPARPLSPWRGVPWLVGAIAAAAVATIAWRRPRATEVEPRHIAMVTDHVGGSVLQVQLGPQAGGWQGTILDAHSGLPVAAAEVVVESPAAPPLSARVLSKTSDAIGGFTLEPMTVAVGVRLRVRARGYVELVRPLPAPGGLLITLTSHRRAALERLVSWSRRRGAPWNSRTEPTPAQIASLANSRSREEIARWAETIERTAYAPDSLGGGQPTSETPDDAPPLARTERDPS
jgi:hypothetical protein